MDQIKQYIEENKQRFLDELFQLIRIPSISAKPENKPDMIKMAGLLRDALLEAGADEARVMETTAQPVVYGTKQIEAGLPTVLIYGHYDVQPVEPLELWNSDPFEPEIREGKIWARGADDDKGQLFMHFKAFEFMVKTGQLPCNVKLNFNEIVILGQLQRTFQRTLGHLTSFKIIKEIIFNGILVPVCLVAQADDFNPVCRKIVHNLQLKLACKDKHNINEKEF